MPSGKTMNSEVGKLDADFIIILFIVRFLKSLLTFVKVGKWDADFNPVEVGIQFAGFSSHSTCLKSTVVADFGSGELGNWVAEFALKIISSVFGTAY